MTNHANHANHAAGGRRFSYWLAYTLKREREKADVPLDMLAALLRVHPDTVRRFEDVADPEEKGYGHDVDRVVAAYAYVMGFEDSRELWRKALARWMREGAPPDFSGDLPGARFVRPIREEAQRQKQARAERSETPPSTGNQQANH